MGALSCDGPGATRLILRVQAPISISLVLDFVILVGNKVKGMSVGAPKQL